MFRLIPAFILLSVGLNIGCAGQTPEQLQARIQEQEVKLAQDGWKKVSSAVLRAEFGESRTAVETKGKWVAYIDADPSAPNQNDIAIVKFASKKDSFRDTGKIRMPSEFERCVQFVKINNGKERCHTVWNKGEEFLELNTGPVKIEDFRYTMVPGNPEKL